MNNNGGLANPGQNKLLPLSACIRPEQINKVPPSILSDDIRQKYAQGVGNLWSVISKSQAGSQDYNNAHSKLSSVTTNIKTQVQKRQQENAQAAAARPGGAGQQAQPGPSSAAGQAQAAATQGNATANNAALAAPKAMSQATTEKVKNLVVQVPPQIQEKGTAVSQKYSQEAKIKYAHTLTAIEGAVAKLEELEKDARERQSQGKPYDAQEQQNYLKQKKQYEAYREERQKFLEKFHETQRSFKAQLAQSQGKAMNGNASSDDGLKRDAAQNGGQTHSVSSALDAARNQAATNQAAQSTQLNQQPGQQAQPGVKAENAQAGQSMVGRPNPQSATQADGPAYPLSHQDAMQQARSFSNAGAHPPFPQNNPQAASHGHPPQSSREPAPLASTHNKMHIPKELNIPFPQPVSMGQARPTMTNGPHLTGPIGQPVIQKHPGYVLEGDGERVLSKKKLEELVRQVTGETGVEGEEGETMTAEVEETLLQVADDFVDQVVISACKLAKLRNSSTLELRDLQLILERNYNIRVPGFASDEIRAVRKIVPSASWTQKLSAVQAAKVTGGKSE